MTRSDTGVIYVGSRRAGKVHAVIDRDGDGRADEVLLIAEDLDLPSGVTWHDGDLYVGAVSTIYRFPRTSTRTCRARTPTGRHRLPAGRASPRLEVPEVRSRRYALPARRRPLQHLRARRALRDDPAPGCANPEEREIVARGVRNSVGFDWDPATGDLWFTDNGRDHLGDEIPPCELNHLTRDRPALWLSLLSTATASDPEFGDADGAVSATASRRLRSARTWHPVGMTFYTGTQLPNAIAATCSSPSTAAGTAPMRPAPLATVWSTPSGCEWRAALRGVYRRLAERDGTRWGRPADVLELPDGSLLVSDDEAGAIYRISYL
jgi:glucose/arabinose dehydrogenase